MIKISTKKEILDVNLIHRYLSHSSYWASGRSISVIRKSIQNSLCFGVFIDDQQIGFGRVATDYAVFAWIMDVFIVESHRGNGYSKVLMDAIMNHTELQTIVRWGLNTKDAHRLYSQYGFEAISNVDVYMERLK